MAKTIEWSKRKKRWILGLSLAMATTIALGVFSACKTPDNDNEEEEDSAALPTDTQILKNGNFEFYTEMTKEEKELRIGPIKNTRSNILYILVVIWKVFYLSTMTVL